MRLIAACALGLGLVLGGCATVDESSTGAPARYEDGGQVGDAAYFRDALSPYGRWVELDPYGLCWLPDGLGPGWSPYSQGFWTYSDYGWTWVDEEPWGWAPFHYGRWWLDPQYGWVWIPGTEWAPAWVAWRQGDAYVAWAPLPPTIHWSFDVPLYAGGSSVAALPDTWWNVARPEDLGGTNARVPLVGAFDKASALARTEDRTRIVAKDNRPFNEGVSVRWIESRVGRPLPRPQVVDAPTAGTARAGGVRGGSIAFFRPTFRDRPQRGVGRPGLRERPPQASVAPAHAAADSTRLETFLDSERKRLAHDQDQERKRAHEGAEADSLARRHTLESQAFEHWAARQREGVRGGGGAFKLVRFDRRTIGASRGGARPAARDSTRGR